MIDNSASPPEDITERIKTFEDACKFLGKGHPFVRLYKEYITYVEERNKENEDVPSYLKLRIIAYALNECWHPQYSADEERYYLDFNLYTQEELDEIPEKERDGLVIYDPIQGYPITDGLILTCRPYLAKKIYSRPVAFICFKSYDLALYCCKQFIDLWIDCLFAKNQDDQ